MAVSENTRARILARDRRTCSGRFLGGQCSPVLDVHHIIPRSEGGSDADENLMLLCHRHHPMLEAIRRSIISRRIQRRRCPHNHRYPHAREQCEQRLNRDLVGSPA